jgi:transposase
VFDQEKIMTLRKLKQDGRSLKEITRISGASRNTVRKYVRDQQSAGRKWRVSRLDAHRDWLTERLQQSPRIPSSVLQRELAERGCAIGGARLRAVVATMRPPKPSQPIIRFETPPGAQAQVDFATLRDGAYCFKLFITVLGYSRWLFGLFVPDERVESLREGHLAFFDRLGGVPATMLYDNPKTIVLDRGSSARARRFHPALWELAGHYGFTPKLCQPHRPQTKGKVERMVRYVRDSFFSPLMSRLRAQGQTPTMALLNAELHTWLSHVANVRIHRQLGVRPMDRLPEELAALRPLPASSTAKTLRQAVAPTAPIARERTPIQRPLERYQQVQNQAAQSAGGS